MDMKRIILTGAVVILAALLAGCGSAATEQPLGGGADLVDTEWVLISLTGQGLIEDTQITLRFGRETVEGSAGCNTYGAGYSATEDSLRLNDLYWTEMGCPEPEGILDQETAYLAALGAAASYQVDAGRLELHDRDGATILVFGAPGAEPSSTPGSAAHQDYDLVATIEAPESLSTGEVLTIKFTLTNTSAGGLYVLKWLTPLEGLAGDIFGVQRDGATVEYRGILVKRGPPTPDGYVRLEAGASITVEVDLAEGYDFSQPGQYTIQFRSPRQSHIARTLAEQADSFEELVAIEIPCNTVTVTVGKP